MKRQAANQFEDLAEGKVGGAERSRRYLHRETLLPLASVLPRWSGLAFRRLSIRQS